MDTSIDALIAKHCTHQCRKYPHLYFNPKVCTVRRRQKVSAGPHKKIHLHEECAGCPGAVPRVDNSKEAKMKAVEKAKIVPKLEQVQCEECGTAFTPWKRGSTTVKKICEACIHAKISRKKRERDAIKQVEGSYRVFLDFAGDDLPLLKQIQAVAKHQRRSVEAQILYVLTDAARPYRYPAQTEGTSSGSPCACSEHSQVEEVPNQTLPCAQGA